MLLRDVKFAICDLETTGLGGDTDKGQDGVCEVALVWYKFGEPLTTWISSYINPERHIPAEASATNHIVDKHVVGAPTIDQYSPTIQWNCDCSVAHNAAFDTKFLAFPQPVLCTLRLFKKMYPDSTRSSNQFIRYFYEMVEIKEFSKCPGLHPHRALYDAITTAKNLDAMLKKLLEAQPLMELETLLAWANEPTILKYIDFGKYKGMQWDQVPREYLEYAWNNFTNMSDDVRKTVDYYLHHLPF